MTRQKYLAAASAAAFAVMLGSLGTTALASSPGCAFGNGCATLHGVDAASHQVAMNAKYQNKHEILIGYPDNPGDGASSFDGVLHFTQGPEVTITQDTSLQVNLLHSTCSGLPSAGLAPVAGAVSPDSNGSLSVKSVPAGLSAVKNSNGTVTLTGTATAGGNLVLDETFGDCTVAEYWAIAASGGVPTTAASLDKPFISRSYPVGGIRFSATAPAGVTGSFSYSGLPSGLSAGSDGFLSVSASRAAKGTYSSEGVTYADSFGASATSAFQLVVDGSTTTTPGNHVPFYTFVYAPNGHWTSQCVTDVNGSGALKLEPCTLGRDKYQDFFALDGSGDPVQIADGITTYHIQNWLASVAKADSCLTDPSSLNPGTPQSDVTDKATSPAGRQLRTDGSCTSVQDLWSWNT